MIPSPEPASTSIMSQFKDGGGPSRTTFASLPREIRDQIYGYIVIAEEGVVAATGRPTDYGNCKGFGAMRKILHASTSNTQFAREVYEVFFHQNTFRIKSQDLTDFVNRKSHYMKNEGYFDVNAWIGCLEVIIYESSWMKPHSISDKTVNGLRQLLLCPRLHKVSIQIECSQSRDEEWLHEILRSIAGICAQLQGKIGDRFKVETDGKEKWGNKTRQPLLPWISSFVESTS